MGIVFVLILWMVVLVIPSCILGGLTLLIAYIFVHKKQFKGKKSLLAFWERPIQQLRILIPKQEHTPCISEIILLYEE